MPAKMDLDLTGAVFTDELHTDVGAAAFEIDHDFFTKEDLVIRTVGGGGGVLLIEGIDYQLSEEDMYLTANTSPAKTVYRNIQVINAAYQTGDLYFSGEYIADANEAADVNLPRLRGHLWGLTLSNNAVDAVNDIDIAAGDTISGDGERVMVYAGGTKQLDAAWAEGTGAGGLDTGAIANATYHVHLIRKDVLGTIDALFSLSATAPTMPTGWTAKRRIGAIIRKAGTILGFVQRGNYFAWKLAAFDVNVADLGTVATSYPLTIPAIASIVARFKFYTYKGAATISVDIYSPLKTDETADVAAARAINTALSGVSSIGAGQMDVLTDNGNIRAVSSAATTVFRISTIGWIDTRGRDA